MYRYDLEPIGFVDNRFNKDKLNISPPSPPPTLHPSNKEHLSLQSLFAQKQM